MDRTSINLVSLVLGGTGLLAALTHFNVPQLRMSFWGANPYLLKRDAIADVMNWLFGGLAVVGLGLQAIAEIDGDALPSRWYTTGSYIRVLLVSLAAACVLLWLLTKIGRLLARKRWRPAILKTHGVTLERTEYALDHDGLLHEHFAEKDRYSAAEMDRVRQQDLSHIDEQLTMIEDLLELGPVGDRKARVERIRGLYSAYAAG